MHCWGLNQGCGQWVIGVPMHDQWLPPAEFVKAVPGLFDGPANMGWPVGWFISHKVGQKTFFDGHAAVQQGHDPGYLILHTSIPIVNYMLPVNMITSKHKVEVPVTSVLIEGKFMGTYAYVALGLICSQPVSLPTSPSTDPRTVPVSSATLVSRVEDAATTVVPSSVTSRCSMGWSTVVSGTTTGSGVAVDTPRVSAAPAWASPDDVRRIVRNLLDNATTHAGSRVDLVVDAEDAWARLDVVDDGPGVPPAHRERIFDRFHRADPARPHDAGSGLGLAIARALAEAAGGRLDLLPSPDGAHLRLLLPASRSG